MKYYQEGYGEITKGEFEAILGTHVTIEQPTSGAGAQWLATVDALEVTPYNAHTSCLVYLDREPPPGLKVARQNAGYLEIRDWKFEQGKHFCPVEIGGGVYDPNAGKAGPFTVWLIGAGVNSFVARGIGWKIYTNHQHPNLYVTLHPVEEPEPPDPEPPPNGNEKVRALILDAQALLVQAQQKLDEALGLLL